jgi:electron transfer flavoprotein alpha subunit
VGAATLVLVPPGSDGEVLGSHLADHLGAASLGRCLALHREGGRVLAERAAWGGRKRITLGVAEGVAVASLRNGKPHLSGADSSVMEEQRLRAPLPERLARESRESGQSLLPLEGARLVVSGGRGVDQHGFAQLEALAGALGGSLGGSLPAVDAGMVPVMRQVGVSGKFVSPDVYLAVGISGTPQHLAGVARESRIVAINQDSAADIFKVASLGIVAPWQELLPELLARLEGR